MAMLDPGVSQWQVVLGNPTHFSGQHLVRGKENPAGHSQIHGL